MCTGRSPTALSSSEHTLRLTYLQELDKLGPTEQMLAGTPAGKIVHFAGEARATDAGDMRKVLNGEKRLTLMISLIHEARTAARDDVAMMFCKRMATIHKRGKERLDELRDEHRAETERLVSVFGGVLAAATRKPVGLLDPAHEDESGTPEMT